MNCERAIDTLSLYMDEQLEDVLKQDVKDHLETCDSCQDVFLQMQESAAILSGLPVMPIPDGFDEKLHEALAEESKWMKKNYHLGYLGAGRNRKNIKINWRRAGSIAAVFVFLIAGAGLYRQGVFDQMMTKEDPETSMLQSQADADAAYGGGADMNHSLYNTAEDTQTDNIQDLADDASAADSNSKKQISAEAEKEQVSGGVKTDTKEAGQSDRGVASQRQMPDEATEAALQIKAADASANLSLGRQQAEATCRDALDAGSFQCSLISYTNKPETGEIFIYQAEGTKDGIPRVYNVKVQIGSQGMQTTGYYDDTDQNGEGAADEQ